MKFACDVMLGALAKWLRVSGHDVFYDASIDRSGLFRVAREEERLILTRTHAYRELSEIPPYHIIQSELVEEQIGEVYKRFSDLDPWKGLFSRCVECNGLLEDVEKDEVLDQLPPLVKEHMSAFHRCASCKHVYWHGTHVDRMKSFLEKALSSK